MTNRILPDAMLAAYLKLGATPQQRRMYTRERGCGHGLGVYAVAEHHGDDYPNCQRSLALADAGYSRDYVVGFYDGFDGFASRYTQRFYSPGVQAQPTEDYKIGWADGKAAWGMVKHLAEAKEAVR